MEDELLADLRADLQPPFQLSMDDLPKPAKPLGQMTRDERISAKEAERTRRALAAVLTGDPAMYAAPPAKRRMGHSRRPDWTLGKKR